MSAGRGPLARAGAALALVATALLAVSTRAEGSGSEAVSELGTPALAGRPPVAANAGPRGGGIRDGLENRFLIDVQVWGQVHKPGQFSVPDDTDIVGLLSFAGGPTDDAKLRSVRLIRRSGGEQVLKLNLETFVEEGRLGGADRLEAGDVLVVPANRSHQVLRLTNVLSFLTLAANVVILAARN